MSGDLAEQFSRKMRAGAIGPAPLQLHTAADAEECRQLAAIFNLPAISELAGDFTLSAAKGRASGIIDAKLALRARLTQTCVVSLEPFETILEETAQLRFVPAASVSENSELAELNPDSLEGPDEIPYAGDAFDLGAVLAEQLALALDPYPRKPGAELPADVGDSAINPFAVLAARSKKPGSDAN